MFLNLVDLGVPSKVWSSGLLRLFRLEVASLFLLRFFSYAAKPLTVGLSGVWEEVIAKAEGGRRLVVDRVLDVLLEGVFDSLPGGSGGGWAGGLSVMLIRRHEAGGKRERGD